MMKYLFLSFIGLSFIAAILGFAVFAGTTAAVFKYSFLGLFIVAMILMFLRPKVVKPVPSSFAASFPSESEPVSKQSS
jgi:uncharacterized membrane protein YfcA